MIQVDKRIFQKGWFNHQLVHPGRLTWNLQITHLERKMIFQTSMIMFHVNLQGCEKINHKRSNHHPIAMCHVPGHPRHVESLPGPEVKSCPCHGSSERRRERWIFCCPKNPRLDPNQWFRVNEPV